MTNIRIQHLIIVLFSFSIFVSLGCGTKVGGAAGAGAPPVLPNTTVKASSASVTADGVTTSTITVTLLNALSQPMTGKTITLEASPSAGVTISAASGPTDANGVVTFTVTSTKAVSTVFTAIDTTDSSTAGQTVTVTFTAGAVTAAQSTVLASPSTAPADGSTTSTVTVTLEDAHSNPVSGKTVTLSALPSSGVTISAASGPSDASGVVTFTVKSTKSGSPVFTAIDSTDSVTVTQTAAITFSAIAPAIAITAPTTGSYINIANNSTTFTVSGTCDADGNGQSVTVQVGGVTATGNSVVSACNGTTWSNTIDTTGLSAGAKILTAVITDALGNSTTSAGISVTVDTTAPAIAITAPTAASYIIPTTTSTTFAVSGTCNADGNGQNVTVQVDGSAAAGNAVVSACNGTTWSNTINTTGLTQLSHTLTAVITDAASNSTTSTGVAVTVDTITPVATPQSVTTAYQTATAITLGASADANVPPFTMTYTVAANPAHGSLTGTAPNLTYTPNNGYYGSDSFTFTASDGTLTSTAATVSITVSELQITLTYTTSGSPYTNSNIFTDAQNSTLASPAWDGVTPAIINVTINSGVSIGSAGTGVAALVTNTYGSQTFPTGTVINVTNNGTIEGAGGYGGNAGGTPGKPGGNGGNAFAVSYPITLNNSGSIWGGGGGGGGGADDGSFDGIGGCGGGGAGSVPGNGNINSNGGTGANGTATLGGAGENDGLDISSGGNGGNAGYSGTAGGAYFSYAGGAGGAAGFAIIGTDLISNSWQATGSYLGNNSNTASGATNTYGLAATLSIISGNNQNGGAKGRTLSTPLIVQLLDDNSVPVAGIPVTWTLNGSPYPGCSASTNGSGEVTCSSLVTGSDAATNTIIATATTDLGNVTTMFTALSNSVCTGGTVTPGTTCTSLTVTNNLGGFNSGIYAGDLNGYEYVVLSSDASAGTIKWASASNTTSATDLDYGENNTNTLIAYSTANSLTFSTEYPAANLCYQIADNGWYLPAKNELNLLYQNKAAINSATGATAFLSTYYWSSTEVNPNYAWLQNFNNGFQSFNFKLDGQYVRCLRRY